MLATSPLYYTLSRNKTYVFCFTTIVGINGLLEGVDQRLRNLNLLLLQKPEVIERPRQVRYHIRVNIRVADYQTLWKERCKENAGLKMAH